MGLCCNNKGKSSFLKKRTKKLLRIWRARCGNARDKLLIVARRCPSAASILFLLACILFCNTAGATKCVLPPDRAIPHGWAPAEGPNTWIICVDVNGDKIQDQFVLIHDSEHIEVLAFVSLGASYRTYTVFTMPVADVSDTLILIAMPAGDTVVDPVNLDKCGTQDIRCTKDGPPIVHLRDPTAALSVGDTAVMFQ
jgi:hypothetical protein